jgi:hypothetical protein
MAQCTISAMKYAIGLRAFTGWAVAVTLEAGPDAPFARDRRRLSLLPPELPPQVYHVAQRLDASAARGLIQSCLSASVDAGRGSIVTLLAEQGLAAADVCAGVVVKRAPPAAPLLHARMSHKDLHASEGELYRHTVISAVEGLGIELAICPEGEIEEQAFSILDMPAAEQARCLLEMGKALGPPWTQREKTAALAGWLALAARSAG